MPIFIINEGDKKRLYINTTITYASRKEGADKIRKLADMLENGDLDHTNVGKELEMV